MHGAATKLKGGLSDANAKIEALQDAAAISSGGKDATAAKLAEVSEELASLKQQHEVNQMALKEQLEATPQISQLRRQRSPSSKARMQP